LRRTSRAEFWDFTRALAGMTAVLMIPYSASAVGVHIYGTTAYQTLTVASHTVARDFLTFPYLAKLALAYFLAGIVMDRVTPGRLAGVAALLVGIALSLTRSYVFVAVLVLAVAGLYALIHGRSARKILAPVAVVISVLLAWTVVGYAAAPSIEVLSGRIGGLKSQSLSDPNVGSRISGFAKASKYVAEVDPLFGLGFAGNGARAPGNAGVSFLGDFMWSSVVVYTGFGGLVLLAAILVFGIVKSGRLALDRKPERAAIGLLVLLLLLWEVGRAFASEGYLWFHANALLSFAVLAVESRQMWLCKPTMAALESSDVHGAHLQRGRPVAPPAAAFLGESIAPRTRPGFGASGEVLE